MKKSKVTWTEVNKLVNEIAKQIHPELIGTQIKSVYGVARGGLVPAVMLSHKLGIPLSNTLKKSALVVDDISDKGDTLLKLEAEGSVNFVASLITRTSSKFWPDFSGKLISNKDWYIFPWETEESSKRDK